jgi:hypothetical protein
MMPKRTYTVQSLSRDSVFEAYSPTGEVVRTTLPGSWNRHIAGGNSLEFCRGLLYAISCGHLPHPALRVVRDHDGKVIETVEPRTEVDPLGLLPQAAGSQWPFFVGSALTCLDRAIQDIRSDRLGSDYSDGIKKHRDGLAEIVKLAQED